MAKLYFYYSTMNAGKSTALLQASHNYGERGMRTIVYTAKLDDRAGGRVASRIGISSDARHFAPSQNLYVEIKRDLADGPIACVLVDEAQFLTTAHVRELSRVVDELNVPVLCYGLRTDFLGRLFEGSAQLLAWADNLVELKTVCHCGRKATMVLRIDASGRPVRTGEQIQIGGNESYVSVCRQHFHQGLAERSGPRLPFADLEDN